MDGTTTRLQHELAPVSIRVLFNIPLKSMKDERAE